MALRLAPADARRVSVPAEEDTEAGIERGADFEVVETDDGGEWDAFVDTMPDATLCHRYRWRGLIGHVFGHEAHYLLARERGGRTRGVLPLVRLKSRLFGHFLVSMPYLNYGGLLADSFLARQALLRAAIQRAHDLGVGHMELRHRDEEVDLPARIDKVAMILELPKSDEILWKGFGSKLRAQIRRPEKDGAVVRQGGAELLDDFYRVFACNMRDLGTPVYPKRFFAAITDTFPDESRLHIVYLGGKPVAAGFLLMGKSDVEVPWASSLRSANRTGVNMLLYWSMLRDAVQRECSRFDFGRSTVDSGTYRFKRQWGAAPTQLRWHYWMAEEGPLPSLRPDNPKYRLAIQMWRRLPVPVANLLGPHIVKNLP